MKRTGLRKSGQIAKSYVGLIGSTISLIFLSQGLGVTQDPIIRCQYYCDFSFMVSYSIDSRH